MRRLAALAAVCVASNAHAHGAAPSALSVLATHDGQPALFRLSRGLAMAQPADGAPRFICQSRWGGPDATLTANAGDGTAFVVGKAGVFRVSYDGSVTAFGPNTVHAGNIRALTVDAEGPVALMLSGEVLQLGAEAHTSLFTMEGADSLAADNGALLVLRADQGVLTLREGGQDTQLSADYAFTPTLVVTNNTRYVGGASSLGYRLDRLDGSTLTPLATSNSPILGPVGYDGTTYAIIDNTLNRLSGETFSLAGDDSVRLTCLGVADTRFYSCNLPNLVALQTDGAVGAPLFAMSELLPPSLEGLTGQAIKDCQLDWLDIAVDAGLPDERLVPAEWESSPISSGDAGSTVAEPAESSSSESCAAGSRGPRAGLGLALALGAALALLGVRRRS